MGLLVITAMVSITVSATWDKCRQSALKIHTAKNIQEPDLFVNIPATAGCSVPMLHCVGTRESSINCQLFAKKIKKTLFCKKKKKKNPFLKKKKKKKKKK